MSSSFFPQDEDHRHTDERIVPSFRKSASVRKKSKRHPTAVGHQEPRPRRNRTTMRGLLFLQKTPLLAAIVVFYITTFSCVKICCAESGPQVFTQENVAADRENSYVDTGAEWHCDPGCTCADFSCGCGDGFCRSVDQCRPCPCFAGERQLDFWAGLGMSLCGPINMFTLARTTRDLGTSSMSTSSFSPPVFQHSELDEGTIA